MAAPRVGGARRQRRADSPPDRGFRKIGQLRRRSDARDVGGRAEATRAVASQDGVSWGPEIIAGFAVGLALPVVLAAAWAPPPPSAQGLFDIATSIVQKPPQQWGCSGSSSPSACDEWLECAKMQEVARIGEETAEQVSNYYSQRVLSGAVLCNQNFVGACGLWWPEQTELLGPAFAQALASSENFRVSSWPCRQLLELVAAGRRAKQTALSILTPQGPSTAPSRLISEDDLKSRAQAALDDEVEKLRQKVDEEGGELVFTPDTLRGADENVDRDVTRE